MLNIRDLTYRIAGRVLFDGAGLRVAKGRRVGLVGRNGSGKSTLFRLITGQTTADDGKIELRRGARIGQVAQEAPAGRASLLETVLAADVERASLLVEAETAADFHRIAEIHTRLADIEAHTAPTRAAVILAGLGFNEAAQSRAVSDYSGGWRMRVSLAAALFARPDLLLLDEPSNHLDLEAALWLESFLATWPGTLLVISHDRNLLNAVTQEIIHLEAAKLTRYQGNYDGFERTCRENLAQQAHARERQVEERQRIQSFVDRFRAKASKARQAQSRLKMLARMEPIASAVEARIPSFDFPSPKPLPPPIIAMDDVAVGYEVGNPVLKDLTLRIDMDERTGLLGVNGNGKSTLLKLLARRLEALSGKVTRPGKLKIGYFAQHQVDELDPPASARDHVRHRAPRMPEAKVRAHLGRFGLSQQKADAPSQDLSGGEKARLLFALMCLDAPHLMLLDEPSNHLDVEAREALVQALNVFEGAVILVSHDSHLLELVCDRLWLVADGACKPFEGDLADYRKMLLETRRDGRRKDQTRPASSNRKEARQDRARKRAKAADIRKAARDAEKMVESLEKEKIALEAKLADPAAYKGRGQDIAAAQRDLGRASAALCEAERVCLEAYEALEKAK